MVKPFQFSRLPLIYFGNGKIKLLPGLIERYGIRILLVTDHNAFTGSSWYDELIESFRNGGISYYQISVSGEPSPELIDASVEKFRNEPFNAVVAIGGGSVLDAGKALSAMMYMEESVKEFLEGVGTREHPGTKLPFIGLPTTSGTGSEATKNAVISEVGRNGFKKSLRHDNFVPEIAIVDPVLTVSCPENITAASGMDCFTQLTEAFLSDKANNYTDAFAREGLKAIKSSLVPCVKDGKNLESRAGMSFAALTSGICLANAGLGVVHGFASSAGGLFNIPHGVLCGTLMASANAVNVRELRKSNSNPSALEKYASLGRLFLGSGPKSEDYYIDGFIQYLLRLTDELELPRLNKYGIEQKDIEMICAITEIKNNPVKLGKEYLEEIIAERL
jgi:alcohol dehydrogenase class IV